MAGWLVLLLWLAPVSAPAPEPPRPQPQPGRADVTIRYAVQAHGAPATAFRRHAAAALAHPRGWSLGGRVRFRETTWRPHFRLHLAAPEALPALGCWDLTFSCRSGDEVVINAERWKRGVPSWDSSLHAYRTMVINHEVGHWLGFGHRDCAALGQRAPVMMQQSMGTAGCRENSWPLGRERGEIRRRLAVGWRP